MATAKKAAVKKAPAPATEKPAKKAAVKKVFKPSKNTEPIVSKETLISGCTNLAATEPAAIKIAENVLNKKDLGQSEVMGVITHGLLHYTAVVMAGEKILKDKLQNEDAAGLLEIVKAQFSIK